MKSVQASILSANRILRKRFSINKLPRMDSNHDKVIQSRFVRLRKRPRVFAALGKGPTRATFHTVVRFRVVELARTGGYTQCSKTSDTIDRNLRRNCLGLTLWKELPQFLERSAIVGDLITAGRPIRRGRQTAMGFDARRSFPRIEGQDECRVRQDHTSGIALHSSGLASDGSEILDLISRSCGPNTVWFLAISGTLLKEGGA
jgi:hypothetical protein